MKPLTSTGLIAFYLAIGGYASADCIRGERSQGARLDTAQVVTVKPIYQTVNVGHRRGQCWNKRARKPHPEPMDHANTGIVTGRIISDAVGHQFAHNGCEKAAIIASFRPAASMDHDQKHSDHPGTHCPGYRFEKHGKIPHDCQSHDAIVGYRVKYRYRGWIYRTRMRNNPGDTIRVRVDLIPMEY